MRRQARTWRSGVLLCAALLACGPGDPKAQSDQVAQRALDRFAAKDLAGAESESRAALQLNPDHADARFLLARVLFDTGRIDDAIVEYRRAITLDPNVPEYQVSLANALATDDRDLAGAAAVLARFLEIVPDHADAKRYLTRVNARLAVRQRDATALIATVDRACAPPRVDGIGFGNDAIDCRCDLEKAAMAYLQAATLDISSVTVHRRLGLILSHMGDHKRAATSYKAAHELEPRQRQHVMDWARALELSGDRQAAEKVLLHTPLPKSDELYLFLELAKIALRSGNEASAVDYYRKATKISISEDDTNLKLAKVEADWALYKMTQFGEPLTTPPLSGPSCVKVVRSPAERLD